MMQGPVPLSAMHQTDFLSPCNQVLLCRPMTDELEVERAAAVEMRRDGLLTAVVTGVYSVVLSGGALYIQHRNTTDEVQPPVMTDPVNYVLSSQMASKVSFSMFPAFVLACLSYAVYASRPQIQAGEKLDPVSVSNLQRTCKALLDRVNMTRMFTNIFAVVSRMVHTCR